MGYYIRVLGKKDPDIPLSIVTSTLEKEGLKASLNIESGSDQSWKLITISDKAGNDVAQIERNSTYADSLGRDELIEFEQEIKDCKPASAVAWLKHFFKTVEVIYAIQVLDFSSESDGWKIIGAIKTLLMSLTQGITQADYEGFSNEDGYHILWQFSDSVDGDWYMAVLSPSEDWIRFKMDLANKEHRAAFFEGKIPQGVRPIQN